MNLSKQIAKHFTELHFGGNMTGTHLREQLLDVTVQEANTKIPGFNTIAALAYHINYYISAVLTVLEGGPLTASDKLSYDHPPYKTPEDWQAHLEKMWRDAENLGRIVDQLPPDHAFENFLDGKYGNWYRNLSGMIEHSYYHMGQIALLKKMVRQQTEQI